ncbi:MAG: DUF4307 domain-containing protein [Actinobacteria bacterium]|nr:DUF4307 domain-containing protein [Actinomycetota bacterium]
MTEASPSLDDRYGRTRRRGVDKRLGWGIAIGALLLGLAVLLFGGWQSSNTVEGKVIHYQVQDPRTVAVDFQVSAPTGTEVACALEALSKSYSTVGWKVVVLPPSDQLTRSISETMAPTYLATTGTVRSCWAVQPA